MKGLIMLYRTVTLFIVLLFTACSSSKPNVKESSDEPVFETVNGSSIENKPFIEPITKQNPENQTEDIGMETTTEMTTSFGEEWTYSAPAGVKFTQTEVTVNQFLECVSAGHCQSVNYKTNVDNKYCNIGYEDRDNHPMNCIDWYGAQDFCSWRGGRLPTEAEWYSEASNDGQRHFPWGDSSVTCNYAIWGDGDATDGCGRDSTWPVSSKPQGNSVSGIHDMSGNVAEWTSSDYNSQNNAKVLRGGSWGNPDVASLRATCRGGLSPNLWHFNVGFRCVQTED